MLRRDVDNTQDCLDVRDVIERYERLGTDHDPDDNEEYENLKTLLKDLQGNGGDHDWRGDWYPGTLIRHSYFVEYCEELVKDIGDMPRDIPSYLVIDWDATADNLKVDYQSVDFDGVEYYYR